MAAALPGVKPRTLVVARMARAAAERHRLAAVPGEAVGLLVGRPLRQGRLAAAAAVGYVPLANAAPDPRRHFRVDAPDLAHALATAARQGRAALAVVHSHPDGPPRASALDAGGAWAELLTVVLAGTGPIAWRAYALRLQGGVRVLAPVPVVLALRRRGTATLAASRTNRSRAGAGR